MKTKQPLKILMILHVPWSRTLGGARVQLELAEELQAMGHEVEKFDSDDAFPKNSSSQLSRLVRPSFSLKAKAFVQANAHRFDIIDAHQGNLPFSKQELGFRGLLVARSVGLYAFYEQFSQLERTKWPPKKITTKLRNWQMSWLYKREKPLYVRSFQACDLINLPNYEELAYIRDFLGLGDKCVVFPFGLSQRRQQLFAQAVQPATVRLKNKQVAFIGSWGARKGARDWGEIVKRTKAAVPDVRFLFLGTGFNAEAVLADLNLPACNWIEIVPRYESDDLPELLSNATIGAFPSYVEGFCFAVLEKLACGLPTVAYYLPGSQEMLHYVDKSLMVPPGNTERFSSQLIKLLKLDEAYYSQLAQRCVEVAQRFSWRRIAKETLDVYSNYLEEFK